MKPETIIRRDNHDSTYQKMVTLVFSKFYNIEREFVEDLRGVFPQFGIKQPSIKIMRSSIFKHLLEIGA